MVPRPRVSHPCQTLPVAILRLEDTHNDLHAPEVASRFICRHSYGSNTPSRGMACTCPLPKAIKELAEDIHPRCELQHLMFSALCFNSRTN